MSEYRRDYYISESSGEFVMLSPMPNVSGQPTWPVVDQISLCTSHTTYTAPCELFHPIASCHVYEVIIREKS